AANPRTSSRVPPSADRWARRTSSTAATARITAQRAHWGATAIPVLRDPVLVREVEVAVEDQRRQIRVVVPGVSGQPGRLPPIASVDRSKPASDGRVKSGQLGGARAVKNHTDVTA